MSWHESDREDGIKDKSEEERQRLRDKIKRENPSLSWASVDIYLKYKELRVLKESKCCPCQSFKRAELIESAVGIIIPEGIVPTLCRCKCHEIVHNKDCNCSLCTVGMRHPPGTR